MKNPIPALAITFLSWAAVHVPCSAYAQDPAEDETLLKAVFVYNFAKFTRWPSEVWTDSKSAFNLCVAGDDELTESLSRLSSETIAGHTVAVRSLQGFEVERCQMLYIAESAEDRMVDLLQESDVAAVLTVSEIPGFAHAGGMIEMYREGDRIRFKINLDTARAHRLQLSARLLDLAELVGGKVVP